MRAEKRKSRRRQKETKNMCVCVYTLYNERTPILTCVIIITFPPIISSTKQPKEPRRRSTTDREMPSKWRIRRLHASEPSYTKLMSSRPSLTRSRGLERLYEASELVSSTWKEDWDSTVCVCGRAGLLE